MTRSVLVLLALLLCCAPATAADRVLTGELVVLDGSQSRFRLVGSDGTFTAPAGTSLTALDGKPVRVELSGNRVTQITVEPIPITPVTSGFETVRGQLVLRDAAGQRFGVVGDDSTYLAPAGLDLHPYVGKWVEASIDANGRASTVTLLADRPPPAPPTPLPAQGAAGAAGDATCVIGDATVASGSSICRHGVTHRCENGAWISLGTACQ